MPLPNPPRDPATKYCLIQANIPDTVFNFFNRMVLDHGWRQQVVNAFMLKFYDAAKAAGAQPVFDPENDIILTKLLEDLNFNPAPKKKSNGKRNPVESRTGRPDPTPAQPTA